MHAPNFGNCLKMLLEDRGISQSQLSDEINIPFSTVNKICTGKRRLSFEVAEYLAKYLNLTSDYLINLQNQFQRSAVKKNKDFQRRLAKVKSYKLMKGK